GDVRLARDGAREERLPGPGRAREEDAVRDPRAQARVLLRAAEEVDDLEQLRLRLVDPGDVGERDPRARRLVAARPRAPERAEHPLHVAGATHQPEEQADEEQRRPEAEQDALPPRRALRQRLRVDDHVLPLEELRERLRVGELRDLGLEATGRLRAGVALALLERALDRGPLRRDRAHVAVAHLLEEERAVRHADARRRLRRARAEPEVEGEQAEHGEEEGPARPEARPARRGGAGRGRAAGASGRGRRADRATMPRPAPARGADVTISS